MTEEVPENATESPGPPDSQHNGDRYHGSQHSSTHYEGPQDHSTHHDGDGDGHLHINGNTHGDVYQLNGPLSLPEGLAHRVFQRPTARRPLNAESLGRLRKLFVPPQRYEEARRTLEASNTVIVTGDPGIGRRSAAMMLLADTTPSSHELPDNTDEESPLDPDSEADKAVEHEGLLLDLSSHSPEAARRTLTQWESFRARVADKQCRLALVLPPEAEPLLGHDLPRLTKRIGRPDGQRVFDNHLAVESVEHIAAEYGPPELLTALHSQRMAELDRLALLVSEARTTSTGGNFSDWVQQALEVFGQRTKHVLSWLRGYTGGHDRALILTAAMLEGASTDAVSAGTGALLRTVRFPSEATHVLERPGIAERLDELGIGVDGHRRIRFDTLHFDLGVRTYFWAEHPDLRTELRKWAGEVVQREELDEQARNAFVVRFAEQCLATDRPDDLRSIAEQWVQHQDGVPATRLGYVELLLKTGLVHERYGRWFRRQIYEWVIRPKSTELPRQLDQILLSLCVQVIAPSHPEQALVRLHHLARRDDENIAQQAGTHIVALTEDTFFFRRVLHRLSGELAGKEKTRDVNLFLRVADPRKLLSDDHRSQALVLDRGVHQQLVTGWKVVLERPALRWEDRIRSWLQAAADDHRGTALLDVLVRACERRTTPLSRLHGISRRWLRDADGAERDRRSRTTTDLADRIDISQNLAFLMKAGEKSR